MATLLLGPNTTSDLLVFPNFCYFVYHFLKKVHSVYKARLYLHINRNVLRSVHIQRHDIKKPHGTRTYNLSVRCHKWNRKQLYHANEIRIGPGATWHSRTERAASSDAE